MAKMKKVLVCLDEATIRKATEAGKGNLSAGIRAGVYDEHSIIHAASPALYIDIERLIDKYPAKHPDFVRRLIATAITVREPIDNVVKRYLEHDGTIAISKEMYDAYREAMAEEKAHGFA